MNALYEVYLITGPGCWYVGSTTKTALHRFNLHRRGAGGACQLTDRMRNLGQDLFSVEVLETGIGDPLQAEQAWFDVCSVTRNDECLNGRRPGGWPTITKDVRIKIGDAHRGKIVSAVSREKMRQSQTGKRLSAETRHKLAMAAEGNTNTRGRKIHTVESKAKIAVASRGRPQSQETRVKISQQRASERMQCAQCEMTTHRGPMARHHNASGHVGTRAA